MAYRGSCPGMCPESERKTRFGISMSLFERDQNNQPNERAMVKEYRRSGADQEEPAPEDLRTPRALELTMDYLVCHILDDSRSKTQELALEWYDFLWDRLRAIRKDITQQNICDQASALLVERCARFHVHSCYAMNRVKNFDVDMNKRNLNDCLQMLRQMYQDLKVMGHQCPGELEFQKYDILLHLNEDHLSSIVLMKTSDYRESQEMKFITQIFNAYTNNQYYKFFHLMKLSDYMTSCILSLYANKMRLLGLKTIVNACAPRQTTLYPANLLIESLGFDDLDDLRSFASALDIELQQGKAGDCSLILNRDIIKTLRQGESLVKPFKSNRLIESKTQDMPVGLLVDGRQELPRVEVLQEIIENNGEVEDTLRPDVGKREEEEEQMTTEAIEQGSMRQKLDGDDDQLMMVDRRPGQAPRFWRQLENKRMRVGETTMSMNTTEDLIVSTVLDEWSESRGDLKIKWLVDGREVSSANWTSDTHDESIGYKAENFFDQSTNSDGQMKHKLVVRYRRAPRDGEPRQVECEASNEYGTTSTRSQLKWARKPCFVRQLEDTETRVDERVVLRVTLEENGSCRVDDLRLLKDGQLLHSSKRDGLAERRLGGGVGSPRSRVTIRSYEETVEVEEEQEEESVEELERRRASSRRYSWRASSSLSGLGAKHKSKRRCRTYEIIVEDVQVDQQGTWECQAENEAGTASCRAELQVFAKPRIVIDPSNSLSKEVLSTVASSTPTPPFSWPNNGLGIVKEEGRVFTETRNASINGQRRPSVTSARREDGVSMSGQVLTTDVGAHPCKPEDRQGHVEPRSSETIISGNGDDCKEASPIIESQSDEEVDEDEHEDESATTFHEVYRFRYKRDTIADIMPAGCYKVRSLSRRLPTLEPPLKCMKQAPPLRRKPTNSPQKSIESLAVSIDDEAKANEMFSQFIQEIDNSIST